MFENLFTRLLDRPPDSHKYQYGHVLVVGGSPGMTGAPLLSAMAALRTGAGLATVASGAGVTDALERRVKEIMTLVLPADLNGFAKARKVSVIVIGPGLEQGPATAALVEEACQAGVPLIIDGGGLQRHANFPKNAILTPHTGEFQRLLGAPLPAKRRDLKPAALEFAKTHGVTLVLKGEPTYVAHPDGKLYENTTGNPGLATAGTGDVLTGVIAGLIAQRVEPRQAVEAAVYLHGLAGDIAAEAKTEPGMIASDVIEAIPEALRRAGRGL